MQNNLWKSSIWWQSVKHWAKQFQTLCGLEMMHHAAAQATAHKTIDAGQMAWNTAYSILPDGQASDKKHEEILQQLHAKATQAWKDTNDVVFNHQLRYDAQLVAFISNAERTLQEKQDKVWRCIHRLADMAVVTHEACLGLTQVLDKLPTIPIDLSYHTPFKPGIRMGRKPILWARKPGPPAY